MRPGMSLSAGSIRYQTAIEGHTGGPVSGSVLRAPVSSCRQVPAVTGCLGLPDALNAFCVGPLFYPECSAFLPCSRRFPERGIGLA